VGSLVVREYGASVGTPTAADVISGVRVPQQREAPFRAGNNGRKTVTAAATPEQLGSGACRVVFLRPLPSNTGKVGWGFDNDVNVAAGSENCDFLEVGDLRVVPVDNLDRIWLDVEVAGEGVCFTYLNHTDD
jgi:hypothetical protein